MEKRPFLLLFDITQCLNPAALISGCPTPHVSTTPIRLQKTEARLLNKKGKSVWYVLAVYVNYWNWSKISFILEIWEEILVRNKQSYNVLYIKVVFTVDNWNISASLNISLSAFRETLPSQIIVKSIDIFVLI